MVGSEERREKAAERNGKREEKNKRGEGRREVPEVLCACPTPPQRKERSYARSMHRMRSDVLETYLNFNKMG